MHDHLNIVICGTVGTMCEKDHEGQVLKGGVGQVGKREKKLSTN